MIEVVSRQSSVGGWRSAVGVKDNTNNSIKPEGLQL
jgi:hypothetical protein